MCIPMHGARPLRNYYVFHSVYVRTHHTHTHPHTHTHIYILYNIFIRISTILSIRRIRLNFYVYLPHEFVLPLIRCLSPKIIALN